MFNSTIDRRPRRLTAAVVVAGIAVVAVAGCSSDAKKSEADTIKKAKPAASVKHDQPASTSTTTAPTGAACTVEAANVALGSAGQALNINCGGGWASGAASNPNVDFAYLLHDVNGAWQSIDNDANQAEMQQACANGNPLGIPANVLQGSPCEVS